jgi:hypothetical protein
MRRRITASANYYLTVDNNGNWQCSLEGADKRLGRDFVNSSGVHEKTTDIVESLLWVKYPFEINSVAGMNYSEMLSAGIDIEFVPKTTDD